MAIETISAYVPKYALPLYTRITFPNHNDYDVGEKYDIRVEDEERQKEKGGKGPYNYTHESLLIAKEEVRFGAVWDILLAFDGHSKSKEEAIERIFPEGQLPDDDTQVVILIFLRLDRVKEWVESDTEVIHPPDSKSDYEGNG